MRWNCKAGKCGSCSAEINGRPPLMCMSRLSEYPGRADHHHPDADLPGHPRPGDRRELQLREGRGGAGVHPHGRATDGPFRMQQVDVERSQEFRKCIECFLCQDTCHVIRDHEDNKPAFSGPRFFLRYAELDMHPNDTSTAGGWSRRSGGSGSATSPSAAPRSAPSTSRSPTTRIIPMKERVVDLKYDPIRFFAAGGPEG